MNINQIKTAFFIAWRYLFSAKKHNIVNVISAISVTGICVCTAALIIVLSVFNGMEEYVISNFNSFNPDLEIKPVKGKCFERDSFPFEEMKRLKNVKYVEEIVSDLVLITYGETQTIVNIKGISDKYLERFQMDKLLIDGTLPKNSANNDWVLAGVINAGTIQLNLNRWEMLKLYYPKRTKKNFANPAEAFNTMYLLPIGVFATNTDYDSKYIFAPIGHVRTLTGYEQQATSVEIRLKDFSQVTETQQKIEEIVGADFSVKDKYQQEELLFKTMKTEKLVVYIILSFILVLAAFNALGSLGMMIVEKKEDIQIIRQLGAPNQMIKSVFLIEGIMVSLAGGVAGMLLGALVCFLQQTFHLVTYGDGVSYLIQYYPVSMLWEDFATVFIIILIISVLSSYFPTRIIKKTERI